MVEGAETSKYALQYRVPKLCNYVVLGAEAVYLFLVQGAEALYLFLVQGAEALYLFFGT